MDFVEVLAVLLHTCNALGLLAFPASLLLLLHRVLGFAALCGHILCVLAFLVVENHTNYLFSRGEAGGDVI
jgi:hypothetical protein